MINHFVTAPFKRFEFQKSFSCALCRNFELLDFLMDAHFLLSAAGHPTIPE